MHKNDQYKQNFQFINLIQVINLQYPIKYKEYKQYLSGTFKSLSLANFSYYQVHLLFVQQNQLTQQLFLVLGMRKLETPPSHPAAINPFPYALAPSAIFPLITKTFPQIASSIRAKSLDTDMNDSRRNNGNPQHSDQKNEQRAINKKGMDSGQKAAIQGVIRQSGSKFYHEEIKMLLIRVHKLNEKCQKQEKQIGKLKDEKRTLQRAVSKQNNSNPTVLDSIIEDNPNLSISQQAALNTHEYQLYHLKNHYKIQIDRIKSDYEKQIRSFEKQKASLKRQLQFQNHCKIMDRRFQQQRLKRQNEQLSAEISQLNQKIRQFQQKHSTPNFQHPDPSFSFSPPPFPYASPSPLPAHSDPPSFLLQSYKEQNAMLRSFIYKIQETQNKLKELEQSRIRERKQFVVYAQEMDNEKKEILGDMENLKNVYEEKIQLLEKGYQGKVGTLGKKIENLQSKITQLVAKNSLKKSKIFALPSANNPINISTSDPIFYPLENSLILHSQSYSSKIEHQYKVLQQQLKHRKQVEARYLQQIQKLRIERNLLIIQTKQPQVPQAPQFQNLSQLNPRQTISQTPSTLTVSESPHISHVSPTPLHPEPSHILLLEHSMKNSQFTRELNIAKMECEVYKEKYEKLKMDTDAYVGEIQGKMEEMERDLYWYRVKFGEKECEGDGAQRSGEIGDLRKLIREKEEIIEILRGEHQAIQGKLDKVQKELEEKILQIKQKEYLLKEQQNRFKQLREQFSRNLQQKQQIIGRLKQQIGQRIQKSQNKKNKKLTTLFYSSQSAQSLLSSHPMPEQLEPQFPATRPSTMIPATTTQSTQFLSSHLIQPIHIDTKHEQQVQKLRSCIQELIKQNNQLRQTYTQAMGNWKNIVDEGRKVKEDNAINSFYEYQNSYQYSQVSKNVDVKSIATYSINNNNSNKQNNSIHGNVNSGNSMPNAYLNGNGNGWEICSIPDFSQRKHQLSFNDERFLQNVKQQHEQHQQQHQHQYQHQGRQQHRNMQKQFKKQKQSIIKSLYFLTQSQCQCQQVEHSWQPRDSGCQSQSLAPWAHEQTDKDNSNPNNQIKRIPEKCQFQFVGNSGP